MKLKLRAKFLIPTIIFIFICITYLGYQSYMYASSMMEDKISNTLEQTSNLLADHINLWVYNIKATISSQSERQRLQSVLTTDSPSKADLENVNKFLSSLAKPYKYFSSLELCNSKGIIVASLNPAAIGVDLSSREYIKRCRSTGKTVISNVVASKTDGKPVFTCTAPVIIAGKISGFLMTVIDCTKFSKEFITPIQAGKNGYAFVADNNGILFAHRDPKLIMKANLNDYEWGKTIVKEKNGVERYTFSGQQKLMFFRTDSLTGWVIGVSANLDDIAEEVAVIRDHNIIGGVVVVLLLSLGLAFLLTRLVTLPINIIMDFLQRTSVGDTSSNKKYADVILSMYKRNDEIGNMTKSAGGLRIYLEKKVKEAQSIAQGDFTANIKIASKNDNLGIAFSTMQERLNKTLTNVSQLVNQVSSGSGQLSDASQSLSKGATDTAASLEEINSSIMQINSQTRSTAENSSEANGLANESKQTADKGNSDVEQMVNAMIDMQQSGEEIAKIVKMIDDIAFQTNLLSLNAAVEAARAGRHGKGFAVVAEEVRNLAGRSAKAAKETADLVEQTVSKLSNGAKIAHKTQESLSKVVNDVVRVADLLGEISTASNEQAEGIAQISSGLQQIDQVTQNNTANAEETSEAANSMAIQAQQLNQLMAQFNLVDESNPTNTNSLKATEIKSIPMDHKVNSSTQKLIELDN